MTFRLFRHRTIHGLFGAIPVDLECALPGDTARWEMSCVIGPDEAPPMGFDLEAAQFSVSFQGFYLFRERPKHSRLSAYGRSWSPELA